MRMGFTAHQANIKTEKIRKMANLHTGKGISYRFSTLSNDCEWIKTVIVACWAVP